jgi:hypothetical protein
VFDPSSATITLPLVSEQFPAQAALAAKLVIMQELAAHTQQTLAAASQ